MEKKKNSLDGEIQMKVKKLIKKNISYTKKMTSPQYIPSKQLLNLTPHDIYVYPKGDASLLILYEKSGIIARMLGSPQEYLGDLDDSCPIYSPQTFDSIDPNEPPANVYSHTGIIVSMPVAEWLAKNRRGSRWGEGPVYSPDTGPEGSIRDERGRIIGTKRLVRYV